MTARPLRVALVGTSGHAARVVAPTIARCPGATLHGALGSRPERTAEFVRGAGAARAYVDFDALLADDAAEAVWISSPNHLHASMAVACVRAGKHVLLEKPMATSVHDACEVAAAAREAGTVVRLGFQHRFRAAHQAVRRAIEDGAVGRVGVLRIHRYWQFPYYRDADAGATWRQDPAQGGGWVINDLGSHLIDLGVWFSGTARLGGATFLTAPDSDADHTAVLTLSLPQHGGVAIVETSNRLQAGGSRIEVYGDGGWIRADDTFGEVGVVEDSAGHRETFHQSDPLEPYVRQLEDFRAAVRGEPSVGADADAGLVNVEVIAGARALVSSSTSGDHRVCASAQEEGVLSHEHRME